jgi:hypothetical protein
MARLFVPLDVGYAEDHKIIAAGPVAELLYIRSLAFVKRARSDGWLSRNQLAAVSPRISNRARAVQRLCDVGLWTPNGDGWYITAWSRHNQPANDIQKTKSKAGTLGNHTRWHTGFDGEPNPECTLCHEQGLIR